MIQMLIAHLIGDWVFQPRKMAVAKGEQSLKGWMWCLLHVTIYTLCFVVWVPNHSVWFYISIFIPHFIIDKFSLLSYWMRLIDGVFWWEVYQTEAKPEEFHKRVDMSFSGIRYAIQDNTIHLVCLYFTYMYL